MPESQHPAVTYSSYLHIDELLACQEPLSDGPEHDELLFIVIHQVYELWFKVLLHEFTRLQDRLEIGDRGSALQAMKRILTILKTIVAQIDVLETMTPLGFSSFRGRLERASGFQSAQFRELEAVLGSRDARVLAHHPPGPARDRIEAAMSRRSLWDSFLLHLDRLGHWIPAEVLERDPSEPHRAVTGGAGRPGRDVPVRSGQRPGERAHGGHRRGRAGVALPAREDGRAHDRPEARHRRLVGRRLPERAPSAGRRSPTCGRSDHGSSGSALGGGGLDLGEPYPQGAAGYAVRAQLPDGTPAVLKLIHPHREAEHEADALALWDGAGAVRLLDRDDARSAILMERCEPGTPLSAIGPDAALDVLIGLLPRLWVPAGAPFHTLADEAAWWVELPARRVGGGRPPVRAPPARRGPIEALEALAPAQGEQVLLHQDLHGDNVLAAAARALARDRPQAAHGRARVRGRADRALDRARPQPAGGRCIGSTG